MKSSKRLRDLLPRDDHHCGIHFGGCGRGIRNRSDASIDHIFTKSFFRDREDGVRPKEYNSDWNLQPMHQHCNNERGGQIYEFPLFTCPCHWLQIEETPQGHFLKLHYRVGKDQFVFTVSTEEHRFVFGKILAEPGGNAIGGGSEVWIGGVWSMGNVPAGKKGIVGKGQLGHAFPRIYPEEVQQFNWLEIRRIEGDSSQSIEVFNRRLDTVRQMVHFEVVE